MQQERLLYLFERYVNNTCTSHEQQELALYVLTAPHEAAVREVLGDYWNKITSELDMPAEKAGSMLTAIVQPEITVHAPRVRRLWVQVAVAASILLVLCTGAYFLFFTKSSQQQPAAGTIVNDVPAPGTNRATITLASGQKIYLDSAANGMLATQANTNIEKLANGQIKYSRESSMMNGQLMYNTLSNPRGSKVIDMQLSDGSHVWLNAGSSVTYPVAFIGNERKVSITGEAYFEVAHDVSKPFKVHFGSPSGDEGEVEVLGTHFNINAYDDEEIVRTTLLEGKVKVSSIVNRESSIIKPGQQAVIHHSPLIIHDSRLTIHENIDTEQVLAWKNGRFVFNKTDIQTTMRQIARWYNVDIAYSGTIKGFFSGSINRTENVSQVLKMLELTDEVHFDMEERKIIVKP